MSKPKKLTRIANISFTLCALLLFGVVSLPTRSAIAQGVQPTDPYYLIQAGDSLWDVAARFGVTLDDLEKANNISNPNQISAGTKLVIPGLTGISGRLETQTVSYGETLMSLSTRYQISVHQLNQVNHLTSPASLYAGASIIVPADQPDTAGSQRILLQPGQSALDMAARSKANPWRVLLDNDMVGGWTAFPDAITGVAFTPVNLFQGKTAMFKISGPQGLVLKGTLAGHDLHFFPFDNGYVALQGIHALTEPGLYPLTLQGSFPASSPWHGQDFEYTQSVLIRNANYPFDPMLQVDPKTVDPAVTKPEDVLWAGLGTPVTPEKLWNGLFQSPVPVQFKDCWPSLFGNHRAYNGGTYDFFHSGLDFCGRVGTELYASAAGKVVYTGSLIVRGNVTVIDHGWGVYTAYDHQSEIDVKVGDAVTPGQLIGLGGATGRTTGPHLHWEVWVGGVQVDPVEWLKNTYPIKNCGSAR